MLHFTPNTSIFFPKEPAVAPPLHGLHFTSGCIQLLQYGVLHGLQVDGYLLHPSPPGLLKGNLCCHGAEGQFMIFCKGCKRTFAFPTRSISSPAFTGFGVWRGCFPHIYTFKFLTAAAEFFYPFLNMLLQGHHQYCWLAHLWSVASLFRSQMEEAVSDEGAAPDLFSYPSSCCQNLAM